MLDPLFKQIIDQTIQVLNAHRDSQSREIMFSRDWEFIFSGIDEWVILYCSTFTDIGGYWIYPELYPESKIDNLKKQTLFYTTLNRPAGLVPFFRLVPDN